MPEIPLGVDSKLELLRAFQISVDFPVHSRICPRMHIARVLHFSAFIIYYRRMQCIVSERERPNLSCWVCIKKDSGHVKETL